MRSKSKDIQMGRGFGGRVTGDFPGAEAGGFILRVFFGFIFEGGFEGGFRVAFSLQSGPWRAPESPKIVKKLTKNEKKKNSQF